MNERPPKPRIVEPSRRQGVMRFEVPEDVVPAEHPVGVLDRVVGTLDLTGFTAEARAFEGEAGRSILSPRMQLTLWLYAISRGIGSAREIARLTIRVMKMPDGGFRPGYNVQFAVAGSEEGGPRTLVGLRVTNVGSDMGSMTPMLADIERRTGQLPKVLLADGNHAKHGCVEAAERAGVKVLMAVSRKAGPLEHASPEVAAWRQRMVTDEAKTLYRARAGLVELLNAHVKSRFGIEQLLVRGLPKVRCVALLAGLAFNLLQNAERLLT
jgi:hypothetical protein